MSEKKTPTERVFPTRKEAEEACPEKWRVFRVDDPDAKNGEAFVISIGPVVQAIGEYAKAVLGISATSRLSAQSKSLRSRVKDLVESGKDGFKSKQAQELLGKLNEMLDDTAKKPVSNAAGSAAVETRTEAGGGESSEAAPPDPINLAMNISEQLEPPPPPNAPV